MAHDNQYKDTEPGAHVLGFECPKKGESYWSRSTHHVEVAKEDMQEKFLIVEAE